MALRAVGGIYVLDSKLGTVRLQGHKGAATPGLARTLTNLTLASEVLPGHEARHGPTPADHLPRRQVPDGRRHDVTARRRTATARGSTRTPTSGSAPSAAGTSASSFLDPSPSSTTPRNVTVQAMCGFGVIPAHPDAAPDRLPAARRDQDRHRPLPEGPVPGLRRLPAHRLPQRRRRLRHRVPRGRHEGLGGQRARLRDGLRRAHRRLPTARG